MLATLVLSFLLAVGGCAVDSGEVPSRFQPKAGAKKKASGKQEKASGKQEKAAGRQEGPEGATLARPASAEPDVVLVVLDTLRADHTSLCGYARPTTPFLQKLVAEHRASYTCDAYAPSAWTLPSHATYFTGVLLPEHHYDSMKVPDWSGRTTLAADFTARGYETVLVTANPVLTKARGLTDGFRHVASAETIEAWRRDDVVRELRKTLAGVDLAKPLFLVVNVMDAHDPYPAIPGNAGWVPKQPRLDFKVKDRDKGHAYHRFLHGQLDATERKLFVQKVTDGYDYGVRMADDTLRELLGALQKLGRVEHGLRLVVTSDHGELLGEHELLRHGGWLWEPVVRVPFVVVDTRAGVEAPKLPPGPFSAAHAYDLLKDGRLPTPLREPVAFESASNFAENPGSNTVAVWSGTEKLVWTRSRDWKEQVTHRYDLAADPHEASPQPAKPSRLLDALRRHVAGYESHVAWREAQSARKEDVAALEALGYLEKAATQ